MCTLVSAKSVLFCHPYQPVNTMVVPMPLIPSLISHANCWVLWPSPTQNQPLHRYMPMPIQGDPDTSQPTCPQPQFWHVSTYATEQPASQLALMYTHQYCDLAQFDPPAAPTYMCANRCCHLVQPDLLPALILMLTSRTAA